MRPAAFSVLLLLCSHALGQCPSGEIPDCNGNCQPVSWIGDGVCDDGYSFPSDFMCEAFNWDEGDCGDCDPGMVLDCNGNCSPMALIGNGICNNTGLVNFACSNYDWDGGDCPVECPPGQFADCNNQCWDDSALDFVNDWHCHSGIWGGGYWMWNQVDLDLDCAEFDFDGGDCAVWACTDPAALNFYVHATDDDGSCRYGDCSEGSEDCMGNCVPGNWIGVNACSETGALEEPAEHLFEGAYPAVLEQVIPVGSSTRGVCVLPDGSAAFAATDAGFVRIDFDVNGLCTDVETIPTVSLYTVAATLDGQYVIGASFGAGVVMVLEVATNQIVTTVPTGAGALKVRMSHNGEWIAVSNHNANTVTVLNASNWAVIETIDVGVNPRNIAFAPDDSYLYVSNWMSFSLGVYETESWTLVEEVPVDYWPQAVWATPDGDYVLVANFGFDHSYDHISVIRTSDWEVIARLQTGAGPEDMMTIGPNGEYLYVTNWGMSCCFNTIGSPCCADEVNAGTATIIALPDFDSIVSPDEIPNEIPYLQSTLATVALDGEYSFGMAAKNDGTRVYVSNKDSQSISILGLGQPEPLGDDCETALTLVAPAFCIEGCTAGFHDDYNEQCPFTAEGAPDLVYRLIPSVTDTVNIDLCDSSFDTKIFIYEGECGAMNSGQALYCNDDFCGANGWRSRLENVIFEAEHTYFLVIDGYGMTDHGGFTLCFENDCPGDLDNNGHVQVADLLYLLQGFGIQFEVSHLLEFTGYFGSDCE